MRGDDEQQAGMFSYLSPEERVPHDHPLRTIRRLVDRVLVELSPDFDRLYATVSRPSVPPEKLLRALLLQVLYTVRMVRSSRVKVVSPRFSFSLEFQEASADVSGCGGGSSRRAEISA